MRKNLFKTFFSQETFKKNLLIQIIIYTLGLCIPLIIYLFIITNNRKVFFVFTLIIVLFYILVFYFLIKRIYFPVKKIEEAITTLQDNELSFNINFNKNNDIYSLANNLNKIINSLRKTLNKDYKNEILKNQAEYIALQSQINPHFLYNTLESIRGEALVKGMDGIAEMTEALATFFRYSISQKGSLVTLRQEIKNVKNYFTIQQYRFNNRFKLKIYYNEDDNKLMDYLLPKMTLQPMVENAICHGLETKIGEGTITIRITATAKRLIINIADDGVGLDRKSIEKLNQMLKNCTDKSVVTNNNKHTGIALINVNQRIKLLFGENYGLTITSTTSVGTDVEIIIPLTKAKLENQDYER